jgi:hypothetical protein
MWSNFKKIFGLIVAITIATGILLSMLSNDSVTTNLQIIKQHKIHSVISLVSIAEDNFEDEDGLNEKARSIPSFLVSFNKPYSFFGISTFQLIESAHVEKRAFLLYRYLRI